MSIGPWREGDTHRIKIRFKPAEITTEYATLAAAESARLAAAGKDVISLVITGTVAPFVLHKIYQPDFTGYKFWLTIKNDFVNTDAQAVMQVVKNAGDSPNDDPAKGLVWLELTQAQSDILVAGKYVYDVQMKSPSDEITTILPETGQYKAKLTVNAQVTRAVA